MADDGNGQKVTGRVVRAVIASLGRLRTRRRPDIARLRFCTTSRRTRGVSCHARRRTFRTDLARSAMKQRALPPSAPYALRTERLGPANRGPYHAS